MKQCPSKWRLNPVTRTEYVDTSGGFVRLDTFWFFLKNLESLSAAASRTAMTMEDLNRMIRVIRAD